MTNTSLVQISRAFWELEMKLACDDDSSDCPVGRKIKGSTKQVVGKVDSMKVDRH